ncbi:FAD-dependent oxidoreductase [Edwardsiella piscicida]|uniref:FAD-dependent oxidoreductase n=1 Tax=Edwardsiella piscicida TaxID=1263550 RepID=UPI0021F476B6|nr:FAD-dependent oxidoreductase [Edwardsiella piscicida]
MDYDLAIVGSGSVGAAAGYYAALAGLRVALFDSHSPPHRLGGHHGDTRIIRHAGAGGDIYTPLALRAQQLWQALEEISALPLFHRCGVLSLAPRDTAFLREIHASAHAHRIAIHALDRAALREPGSPSTPWIAPRCANAGRRLPRRSTTPPCWSPTPVI